MDDKKNISVLHLISSLNCGGVESVVVNLCNRLTASGIRTAICVLQNKTELAVNLDEKLDIPIFTCGLPLQLRPGNAIECIKKMRGFIRQFKPDVIHSHLYSYTAPFAHFAAKGTNCRQVLSLHFSGIHYYDPHVRHKISRACERWTIKHAAQTVVGCSDAVNQMAKKVLGVSAPKLIYNGIDTNTFWRSAVSSDSRQNIRNSIGTGPDDILVACVGHLREIKNQKDIIAAFPKIITAVPKAKLVIIGDGPDKPDLEKQVAELCMGNNVIFLGRRSDIPELLAACDAGILYSRSEGMPVSIVEMMAMELPVIGSDIPAIREIVSDDFGMLAPSDSPDELANVCIRLLSDGETMQNMGRNGRKKVESEFSLAAQAAAFCELYEELLNKKS